MKRYLKYIFIALTATIVAASCIEEMQLEQPVTQRDELTLVPRVKSFTNQYVTKAGYSSAETKISRLAVLVFNSDGNLVHLQEAENATSVMLNKSMLNTPAQSSKLASSTLVMIANVELDDITKADGTSIRDNKGGLTLVGLNDYSLTFDEAQTVVSDLGEDFTGFPMVGTRSGVNLSPSNEPAAALEVPLQILFAKINFSISVEAGTENQNITSPSFSLGGYSVHNVSQATSYTPPTGATLSTAYAYKEEGYVGEATGTASLNGPPVTFTLYVAESRFLHNSDLTGIYPSADWLNTTTYDHLKQQYKPVVADLATGLPGPGLATYVTLKGTYLDYRGAQWNVNYDVYLGKDNHSNFEVDRNSEYTNHITIKGIRNNSSHNGEGQVWLDHRVDVSATTDNAANVTITRETLIDAHFEVRPLRVRWDSRQYTGARIYLPTESDGSLINWIGIERFTGSNCQDISLYCHNGELSTGKRRYFTEDLIAELQAITGENGVQSSEDGRKYLNLANDDCAWIYLDENVSFSGNMPASDREASIVVEFIPAEGDPKIEEYKIKQRGLKTVGSYNIESYEEYLHSYDSEDTYTLSTNPIDYTQKGLAWGLDRVKISNDYIVSAAPLSEIDIIVTIDPKDYISWRYDYFHDNDQPSGDTYYKYVKDANSWSTSANRTGLNFTDHAASLAEIKIMDMATIPENAYQYCLSKNKFEVDSDGNTELVIHWYLPDVYELQTILGESLISDIGTDAYYWSSQPSSGGFDARDIPYVGPYLSNLSLIDENTEMARAVSTTLNSIENRDRDEKNRIRCLYSKSGITVEDMSERTPDGVGGHYTFHMKAYNNGRPAFFYEMLEGKEQYPESGTDDFKYKIGDITYPFPSFTKIGTNNPFEFSDQMVDKHNVGHAGFMKNPLSKTNWLPYSGDNSYYSVLNEFNGLTEFEVEEYTDWFGQGQGAFKPIEGDYREDIKVDSLIYKNRVQEQVSGVTLDPLNRMLNIGFSAGTNMSTAPTFYYSEYSDSQTSVKTTYTRRWAVPTYESKQYIPADTDGGRTTVSGEGEASVLLSKSTAEENAKKNAYNDAYAKINITESPNFTYTYKPSYTLLEESESGRIIKTYYYKYKCDIDINWVPKVEPITYYGNADGGGWYDYSEVPKYPIGIINDELRIYSGQTFTVSLNEDYAPDYEITKVKVYYSGGNQIDKKRVDSGLLDDTYTYYARFIESSLGLTHTTQNITGMSYHENENGMGYHQWTGAGKGSVTLVLAEYITKASQTSISYEYTPGIEEHYTKYIIVDRIEVQCKKIE